MASVTKRRTVEAYLLAQARALDVAVETSVVETGHLHSKSEQEFEAETREAMTASLSTGAEAVGTACPTCAKCMSHSPM